LRLGILSAILVVSAACAERGGTADAPRAWHLGEPVIDSHVHVYPNMIGLSRALDIFDRAGIGRFVVKSGGAVGTPKYRSTLAMQRVLGDRMGVFANLDWEGVDAPDWVDRQLAALEQMRKDGVIGIKIFKNLGLGTRLKDGSLLKIDDPRLAPIFEACGRLGLILAWHVADPVAFFEPVTPDNERYDELRIAKGWSFHGEDYPSFRELMDAMVRVIARHPKTTFLLIHMGCNAEDLDFVDRRVMPGVHVRPDVLEACPMRVVLPDGDVPVVDASIVAGRGFRLEWGRPA